MKEAILCVDDEAVVLLSLKMELRLLFGQRYSYESALSGSEAEEIAAELEREGRSIPLVITDWLMPGLRGDELLIHLKRSRPGLRGIIITGNMSDESFEAARAQGGLIACVRKPWSQAELNRLILAALDTGGGGADKGSGGGEAGGGGACLEASS
ncbi:MAG: response regulator [Spirochaetaceae bacterium]|nr:response regulator [Spirochaetaceae bacterium]